MKKSRLLLILFFSFVLVTGIFAGGNSHVQYLAEDLEEISEFENRRYFIGSSLFVLYNVIPDQSDPPDFYQLNFGYWLSEKDVISIEAITWRYNSPLGIPLWEEGEKYPGYVREFGLGIAYQRHLWKGLYTALHVLPLHQSYMDENDNKIQNGFQLFCTMRLGYHLTFFNNRFFIEPGVAMTFWPFNTNVPDDFKKLENDWGRYNFEPGLHCGYKFRL